MLTLPEVSFCGKSVSRLIIGGNPFSGNSHQNAEKDAEMEDFFTTERIKETLYNCLRNGINTAQLRGDKHIMRILREFRLEGGSINWIGQTAPEMTPYEQNVRLIQRNGAFALYHHGTVTDELFKAKEYAEIERRLGVIRQSGMAVGLGSHMPEVFEYAEDHHWDVDFYMCCVHNLSKVTRVSSAVTGKANEGEPFDDEDRPLMYEMIRSTSKPCLAFKILGAGRHCATSADVEAAFSEAFSSIKPSDAVIVGMYPRYSDQVTENADIVRRLLGHNG